MRIWRKENNYRINEGNRGDEVKEVVCVCVAMGRVGEGWDV